MSERYSKFFKIDPNDPEPQPQAVFVPIAVVSYGAVLYTVLVAAIAAVAAAAKFWGAIKPDEKLRHHVFAIKKLFPELSECIDFVISNTDIDYTKELFEYIISESLNEVSTEVKEKILIKNKQFITI